MKRLLMSGLILVISLASAWTPPERVDRKPDNYVTYDNDIAVDRNGTPHIVWSECKRETYYEKVMYSRRNDDTWTIPVNISRDSGDLRHPAIVVDTSGVPLVVWTQEGSQKVRYVRLLGDSWSTPELCFSTRGITPILAIDSRNRIHLLFEKLGGRPGVIWYSYYISEADSWAEPCTVAKSQGELGWSDITVDRQDHLHAVWMSWATLNIEYGFNDGTGWSAPEEVPNPAPGTQAGYPRVATDTFNQPHVVWQEGDRVYYSCKDGDTWTCAVRLCQDPSGYPVICADSLNRLHVVYLLGEIGMRYIVHNETGWTQPESLNGSTSVQELVVGAGCVHLAFSPRDFCLYYTKNPIVPGVREGESHPHPFGSLWLASMVRGEVVMRYELVRDANVSLSVFDITGRCLIRIGLGRETAGCYTIRLPAKALGDSGVKIFRLAVGGDTEITKTVILR